MSPNDLLVLSSMISMALGSVVIPWMVAFVIRQQWAAPTKRIAALGVSAAAGLAQWYIESVMTGKDSWHGLALTIPIIFTLATASYIKFWQQYTGPVEEFDAIGAVLGAKK